MNLNHYSVKNAIVFNHKSKDFEKETIFSLCAGNHTMKDCQKEKIECSNCRGDHPAFSKKCQKMIDQTNELLPGKKLLSQKYVSTAPNNASTSKQASKQSISRTINQTSSNVNINAVLVSIISNLSLLLGSKKLDMSSLVKIKTTIENLTNVYTPPSSQTDFNFIIEFLKENQNLVILGDLNAVHPMWSCGKTNKKGKLLAEIIDQLQIIVLNSDQPTFSRSKNILDLALVLTSLLKTQQAFKFTQKRNVKRKKKLQRTYSKTHDPIIKNQLNNTNNTIQRKIQMLNKLKCNSVYEKLSSHDPSE
ncbi:RNA-directed DNA polymerase from mobile element jockey [Brachionus plicatilis]|uniref:RNA-directed DNA polymerase from mobile element jockey n=1 Tax=Brachionus plicatilis TaxID=10195 RepID=A0A3M7P8Y5_BRAPC|nr:RNA-directed DNA polymerase from mobile element jockey [Brachionus plicatilis]